MYKGLTLVFVPYGLVILNTLQLRWLYVYSGFIYGLLRMDCFDKGGEGHFCLQSGVTEILRVIGRKNFREDFSHPILYAQHVP